MLKRVDRIQLAVRDRAEVAAAWTSLLGAEHDGDEPVEELGARRTRLRLGSGWVELLEPHGEGPITAAVGDRGDHLYAAGVATDDLAGLSGHLRDLGAHFIEADGQIHLDEASTGGHGLRVVVSEERDEPEVVGAVSFFYEVTNLVREWEPTAASYADLFGLDPAAFVPISSDAYGYEGVLTLFDADHLYRLEVITPTDPDNTMGRFFQRRGETLYMAFAEAPDLERIEERSKGAGLGHTPVRDKRGLHTLFLHPGGLGGMMLGLSRPTWAWTWSGHPERVER